MTHNQSALSALIQEVLTDPDLAHSDVFRRMLQAGLQDLINAEATARIGAAPHERTPERTTRRNGTRPKTLATPAGEVELAIPKLREGSFFPSPLSPRRRVDKALYAVICQAWINGVSTRKVDQLVRALGNETGISRSTVSWICTEIDEAVAHFLTRRLDHTWFPYLFLDATYLDVRVRGRVVSQALVVATAVSGEGRREILGISLGDAETTDFWTSFLRSLRDRGRVHFSRNVTQRLGSAHSKPVNALISTIFAQTTHKGRHRPIPGGHRLPGRFLPPDRPDTHRRRGRPHHLRDPPARALAKGLVQQPHRAAQPRNQAPRRRRPDLPRPPVRQPPHRRSPPRTARGMAIRRTPLLLRHLHAQTHPHPHRPARKHQTPAPPHRLSK